MLLLRDLWATAPWRMALVAFGVILAAAAAAVVAPLSGLVLAQQSRPALVALAAALIVKVGADLGVELLSGALTADWSADLRVRLCRTTLGQDLPTLERTPVGELLDRIDGDVYEVGSMLRGEVRRLAQSAAMGVAAVVTAFVVWWPAGSAMLAGLLLVGAGLRGRTSRIADQREAEEAAWSDLAAVMEESIHGQDDVRSGLGRPYVLQVYAARAAVVLRRGAALWRSAAVLATIAGALTRLCMVAVLVGGVWAMSDGQIDAARLTGLWLLTITFGMTVERISYMIPDLQYALGAWARVARLAAARQEHTGTVLAADGDLELRGLTVVYPTAGPAGERAPALRDVSLTLRRGRSYALIGRTGSGKSTLAKALVRAVDTPRGQVFLAGVDICDLDLDDLRRWTALVPQHTDILTGTLAENIALFESELLARVPGAVAELGLTDWVATLPGGLQTRLGEGGHTLSAGQEQLVAFARILVRDPRVVILDEATARLDPVTEAQVHRATRRLLAGRIGLLIAHRLSTVRECDEVLVLADGRLVEAGPLAASQRFARLLADSSLPATATATATATSATTATGTDAPRRPAPAGAALSARSVPHQRTGPPERVEPPVPPPIPPAHTFREILRLAVNDPRYGLAALAVFVPMLILGGEGSALPWLWARVVDGQGDPFVPAAAMIALLMLTLPAFYVVLNWFPHWWTLQNLRVSLRLVHGQTGPRRRSRYSPAEVVAQGGDIERVVRVADNLIDQVSTAGVLIAMTLISGSLVPAAFFGAVVVTAAVVAAGFGRRLAASAGRTVAARAAFAGALVSSLSAARTVKLAGATTGVLAHLAALDAERSLRLRREVSLQVVAQSAPGLAAGLGPIGVWVLYLSGTISSASALIAVSSLGGAAWLGWTTASLVSALPSARVWTERTVAMAGTSNYSASVPGVDLHAGLAPVPQPAARQRLSTLTLRGFGTVHSDGTVGVRDVDLEVRRGEIVLLVGTVGSGKSSLLRALAGLVDHEGTLLWNGREVHDPAEFLRPNQVAYVAQLPRVLSGTVSDNIALGHPLEVSHAVTTARLDHDLEGGLGLMIGHKGVRLSGGQLQRLALARALAPQAELLVADDVSSALDVTTELEVWQSLRERGVTVIGASAKRAALVRADRVVVLHEGRVLATGPWSHLEARWGHLAG